MPSSWNIIGELPGGFTCTNNFLCHGRREHERWTSNSNRLDFPECSVCWCGLASLYLYKRQDRKILQRWGASHGKHAFLSGDRVIILPLTCISRRKELVNARISAILEPKVRTIVKGLGWVRKLSKLPLRSPSPPRNQLRGVSMTGQHVDRLRCSSYIPLAFFRWSKSIAYKRTYHGVFFETKENASIVAIRYHAYGPRSRDMIGSTH